jgi:hypothetical protein
MSNKPIHSDPIKTILVIVVGFLIVYVISKWQGWLGIALFFGILSLLSDYLAKKIDFLWMKLSWLLGLIVPNILLSIIFFVFLTPIALLSRIGNKDPLSLKHTRTSLFKEYHKDFNKASFEKPW